MTESTMLDIHDTPIEICASEKGTSEKDISTDPTASVIWLHGLGADGTDFVPVVNLLNLPHVRFILPHALHKKVSANNGYEMRAWYDVFGFAPGRREDEAGIHQSQAYIESLISKEIARGIPANRIVLAGFSQGGAVALQTALRHEQALGGVMASQIWINVIIIFYSIGRSSSTFYYFWIIIRNTNCCIISNQCMMWNSSIPNISNTKIFNFC